jgi:hypothetical protein
VIRPHQDNYGFKGPGGSPQTGRDMPCQWPERKFF